MSSSSSISTLLGTPNDLVQFRSNHFKTKVVVFPRRRRRDILLVKRFFWRAHQLRKRYRRRERGLLFRLFLFNIRRGFVSTSSARGRAKPSLSHDLFSFSLFSSEANDLKISLIKVLKKDRRNNEKGECRAGVNGREISPTSSKKTDFSSGRNFRAVFVQIHIRVSMDLFCTIF